MSTSNPRDPDRSREERNVIPSVETPCLWMAAGVLTYRLCDRELECVHCPLDRALRNLAPSYDTGSRGGGSPGFSESLDLPADVFLHLGHAWVRMRGRGELEVGLDELGGRLLGRVRGVRRPDPRTAVAAGATAFSVVHALGDVPVSAPFDGVVLRGNPALETHPELLVESPYERGWVYRARPQNSGQALNDLLEGARARRWEQSEANRVRELLFVAASHQDAEGGARTLPDGGQIGRDPLGSLAPEAAWRVFQRFFRISEMKRQAPGSRAPGGRSP